MRRLLMFCIDKFNGSGLYKARIKTTRPNPTLVGRVTSNDSFKISRFQFFAFESINKMRGGESCRV